MDTGTDQLELAELTREAREAMDELPDFERAIMLMRGTLCGRPHLLCEVARTFGVTRAYVRMVEAEVFRMLGPEWFSEWRAAREATRNPRRTPVDRRHDHDRRRRQPGRQVVIPETLPSWPSATPRERRGGCNTRRRGSRRGTATRTGARGDPDLDEPRPSPGWEAAMSAPERRCANPVCRDDISDLRADAVVCRRKACRSWRDRRPSLYSPCTGGCPERGWCERHNRFNRPPRPVSEATGGGGKRIRAWSDFDHVGKPGLWELWAKSLPDQFPQFERTSKHYTPACRGGRIDKVGPAGLHPHELSPSMGSRFEPDEPRSGIEALRQAATHEELNIEVACDGWVTVGQEVDAEPDDLDDLTELREAA